MRESGSARPRAAVLAGALACVLAASYTAHAERPTTTYPQAGCSIFTDPAGDATPITDTTTPAPAPGVPTATVGTGRNTNAASLDITAVSYRTSAGTFATVVRVPGLAQGNSSRGVGDYWVSNFTVGKRVVAVRAGRLTGQPSLDPTISSRSFPSQVSIDGVANTTIAVGAEFDYLRGYVTISAGRDALERVLGASLTEIKTLSVTSATNLGVLGYTLDTATAPAKLVVNPTDNFCF